MLLTHVSAVSCVDPQKHQTPCFLSVADVAVCCSVWLEVDSGSDMQLIGYSVAASLTIDREQAEYDVDSEDEQWLLERGHLSADNFERMMELLEGASSDMQICQPKEARSLLKDFDDDLIDDVYDYWLQKRKVPVKNSVPVGFDFVRWEECLECFLCDPRARCFGCIAAVAMGAILSRLRIGYIAGLDAAATRNIASLIPRVKTDNRRDAPGSVNPYVAFRRRAEKIQTRRNRKNDEDSYEKMIKLGYDLGRALILFEMMWKREQGKLEMTKLDEMIFDARWNLGDSGSHYYNQLLSKLKPDSLAASVADESQARTFISSMIGLTGKERRAGTFFFKTDEALGGAVMPMKSKSSSGHKKKKHARNAALASSDKDVLSRAWLKKVAETWNRPPVPVSALSGGCSQRASSLADAESSVAAAEAAVDGRYAFKRRRGCVYRDVLPSSISAGDVSMTEELEARLRGHPPSPLRTSAGHCSHEQTSAICKDPSLRFYKTFLPSSTTKGVRRCIGYARRRAGRGGRIIFDRFLCSPPSTSQRAPDYMPHPYIDLTRTYEGHVVEAENESDAWSLDSEDERLEKEREEQQYARRDEIFRMRIFDGSSPPITQRLQTDALSNTYEYVADRRWTDMGGSSSQRSALEERGSYFRPSLSLKDGSGVVNGFHPCNVASSTCESGPINEISSSNRRILGSMGRTGSPFTSTPDVLANGGSAVAAATTASSDILAMSSSACRIGHNQVGFLFNEKRIADTCLRIGTVSATSSSSTNPQQQQSQELPIFYPHLPPSETNPIVGLVEAGGQHQPTVRIGEQPTHVNGVKRAKGSAPSIAQLASSIVAEASLKRLGSSLAKLGVEGAVNVVDTKRLELAIAGSGARIKVSPLSSSLCASAPMSGMTDGHGALLIEALKSPPTKAVSYSAARHYHQTTLTSGTLSPTSIASKVFAPICPHAYSVFWCAFQLLAQPLLLFTHVTDHVTSQMFVDCYASSDHLGGITSSPDSESMSPPMSTSPAVVPELGRHFGLGDAALPTPVAVVSGNVNGINSNVQVDKTRSFICVESLRKLVHAYRFNLCTFSEMLEIHMRSYSKRMYVTVINADGELTNKSSCRSGTDNICARRVAPRAEVAAIPRCGSAYVQRRRHPTTTPIVSLSTSPQPMDLSPSNATPGELYHSADTSPTSPSSGSFYVSSELAANKSTATHIGYVFRR
ncbi:unnamed protein product [Toxocara canis]|uniref:PHD-type domain-containing protein n=1 Tax=Toxocara canis TaxID=6265 RepID=A0A183UCA2_TOXCA|nr:unnamed protein product [Toxocara canis]